MDLESPTTGEQASESCASHQRTHVQPKVELGMVTELLEPIIKILANNPIWEPIIAEA